MDKFTKFFTDRSRRALKLAQQEAEKMHHAQIGTEHLLLGLLREEEGIASRVLRGLGVQSGDVQHWVERLSTVRQRPPLFSADLDLTPRTKRVLELAGDEEDIWSQVHAAYALYMAYRRIGDARLAVSVGFGRTSRIGPAGHRRKHVRGHHRRSHHRHC